MPGALRRRGPRSSQSPRPPPSPRSAVRAVPPMSRGGAEQRRRLGARVKPQLARGGVPGSRTEAGELGLHQSTDAIATVPPSRGAGTLATIVGSFAEVLFCTFTLRFESALT